MIILKSLEISETDILLANIKIEGLVEGNQWLMVRELFEHLILDFSNIKQKQ